MYLFCKKKLIKYILLCSVVLLIHLPVSALTIIQDTESQRLIDGYVTQIFRAAGLPTENVTVILVNDPSINAFVAYGQTIFVHTGLILNADTPDEVLFVLAHETGHIAAGHITTGIEQYKSAQRVALISGILGGLAGLAGGRPDAGAAIFIGSQSAGMGLFSAYRKTQEHAADKIAADIMNQLGYSSAGFQNIMHKIQAQERLASADNIPPYLQTHPMTANRLNTLTDLFKKSTRSRVDKSFYRVKAKLAGFLLPITKIDIPQPATISDRYKYAVVLYRTHQIKQALAVLDTLIQQEPENPFFHELKGQILFETGSLKRARLAYQAALNKITDAPLIHLALAHILLEINTPDTNKQALSHLITARLKLADNPFLWQLTATAYHRHDQPALTHWAMAEYMVTLGKTSNAQKRAKTALEKITNSTPDAQAVRQRLNDILSLKNNL